MDTIRGSWWSVTINNPTEQDRQTIHGPAPRWLRMIRGQEELGANGTLHYQLAVNTQQIRASQIKEWLPRAHIEVARNPNALANYVNKDNTAVPDTQFEHNYVNNANGPLTMANVLMKIAEIANVCETERKISAKDDNGLPLYKNTDDIYRMEYWSAVEILLGDNENLVALLTQPQYERAWVKTRRVWLMKLAVDRQTELSVGSASPAEENILVPISIGNASPSFPSFQAHPPPAS